MKPLPASVLKLLDRLPDAHPHRIILNTDGHGQWDVEVTSRYTFDDRRDLPLPGPLREKAVRQPQGSKKSN